MLIKRWKRKRNNKKAAAALRRLLMADEKDLPRGLELTYENKNQGKKV